MIDSLSQPTMKRGREFRFPPAESEFSSPLFMLTKVMNMGKHTLILLPAKFNSQLKPKNIQLTA